MSGHSRDLTYRHVVYAAVEAGLNRKQILDLIHRFVEYHHPLVSEYGNHPRNIEIQEKGIAFMTNILDNQKVKIL